MKHMFVLVSFLALAGCGVEVATTAATVATMKKQEIEQGKKTMDQMQQQINQTMESARQNTQQSSDAVDKN